MRLRFLRRQLRLPECFCAPSYPVVATTDFVRILLESTFVRHESMKLFLSRVILAHNAAATVNAEGILNAIVLSKRRSRGCAREGTL